MSTNRDGREWLDSDGCFLFGKYGSVGGLQGDFVENVAKNDPSYLHWILENVEDIFHEDRDVIETALQFRNRK